MDSLKVGVLCGGRSSERAVSLRSGRAVAQGLKRAGFRVRRIDPKNPRQTRTLLRQIDLAFIALHGHGGEDGSIQKRLSALEIPYTGSGERGSRLAFHKVEAKKIFDRLKIPTPEWTVVNRKNWKRLAGFPAPFFVKPVADGSSIGVFLVEDFKRSAVKIIHALSCYGELLVERQIKGREFTVGILGRKTLPVIELRPKRSFYDYRSKYTRGMTDYLVPAPIPEAWRRRFQQLAGRVHRALGLRDLSRVDLVTDSKGRPYVLEANTIPGFTELSLLPKAAGEAGISFEGLCRRLVEMAWLREKRNGKA
ncbi:MAG: D-alanine--D-alanine ligase [Candidatus Omnitrophica bacterium]|nr:D-alanine--D-alanine ligase [Candidatus Omnitrophota bacterium]